MMKYSYLLTLLCFFYACKKNESKQSPQTKEQTKVDSSALVSEYAVIGDQLIIPTVEIEVRPSENAAKILKSKKETVIIAAFFYGFPKDKKDEDEVGQLHILDTIIELPVDKQVARFENLKFAKAKYDALTDKDIHMLINVYTGRRSSKDNLIDAGIVDEKASIFKNKRYVLNYKMISEPNSVAGGTGDIVKCYALPAPEMAKNQVPNLLIECDEKGNMKWGEKSIKDFEEFKKLIKAELMNWKKQGATELPGIETSGCMMGASSELKTMFEEIKASLIKPETKPQTQPKAKPKSTSTSFKKDIIKPKTTEVYSKNKPVITSKSVTSGAAPSVALSSKGGITLAGKAVKLESLKKELQAKLSQYQVIPDKVDLKTIGETGMGMRAEVNTEINSAISGAKWLRKKAAIEALNASVTKTMKVPTSLELADYQTYMNYAFVIAVMHQPNGKTIDFNKTPFKKERIGESFSEDVFGVLKYENGRWKIIDTAVGATDVPYGCWWKEHKVPKTLFSKYSEALCD